MKATPRPITLNLKKIIVYIYWQIFLLNLPYLFDYVLFICSFCCCCFVLFRALFKYYYFGFILCLFDYTFEYFLFPCHFVFLYIFRYILECDILFSSFVNCDIPCRFYRKLTNSSLKPDIYQLKWVLLKPCVFLLYL